MTATSKEANPLTSVDAWLYHLGEVDDQRAREIAVSGADLIVMDYADDDQRHYAPARLDAVRGDGDKLVVSYLSVGEAEEYRSYWERNWNDAPPSFLFNPNPEWPDNYEVAYSDEQWREIVFDYVDDIVEAGFDGLYLDILDAYEFWEKTDPRQGDIYRSEMVRFVADIRAHAETRLREIGDERGVEAARRGAGWKSNSGRRSSTS